ncbi:MAG: 23S rRNA (adenine(2503)-C(2))-methyltransferase RlmN [Planctomycetota bacterium]
MASLLELEPADLVRFVLERGGQPFHAKIARRAVVGQGVLEYERMTSLPAPLRARLAADLPIFSGREIDRRVAPDRTTKLLVAFPPRKNEDASVEMVHMPSLYLDPDEEGPLPGATLCVSTQVGCPIACPFCASGKLGLLRNLEAHEILEQFLRGRAIGPVARAVVMGMGEPLLNFESLSRALDAVHDEMGIGSRKVTVSTVGFPERLRKIAPSKPRFQLAISLHTVVQEQRDVLVPAMRGTPVEEILAAGDDWFEKTGREVTYEVALLAGENDSPAHARALAGSLRGKRCTVNLIPFNTVDDSPYHRPAHAAIEAFQTTLSQAGIVVTVRYSRGLEGDAACGQLRVRSRAGARPG